MRQLYDIEGNLLKENDVIVLPKNGSLNKVQVLKICKNTVKVSCFRQKGSHYTWISINFNVSEHNSFQYIYLSHFLIVESHEIPDLNKLKAYEKLL